MGSTRVFTLTYHVCRGSGGRSSRPTPVDARCCPGDLEELAVELPAAVEPVVELPAAVLAAGKAGRRGQAPDRLPDPLRAAALVSWAPVPAKEFRTPGETPAGAPLPGYRIAVLHFEALP